MLGPDAGVFRGVLPLPLSVLKGVGPFLVKPLTRGRAITLTLDQFKDGWANALGEKEAKELYQTFRVAGSGISLVQMGNANLNPRTEAKVDTKNPDRGPLLIIDGEKDHTVPWAIANAAFKWQRRNPGVTEITGRRQGPDRLCLVLSCAVQKSHRAHGRAEHRDRDRDLHPDPLTTISPGCSLSVIRIWSRLPPGLKLMSRLRQP